MDAPHALSKRMGKKLDGNYTASTIEHVLETGPYKATGVRPPITHHEIYQIQTNLTCGTLLEM